MLRDFLSDSWTFQETLEQGREEGREQGREQGRQQTILLIMQARFPELAILVKSQVEQIHDEATLNALTLKTTTAQTGEEIVQFLARASHLPTI